jgi:Kdo2-lipid IVA 3' secondary acyltransferase
VKDRALPVIVLLGTGVLRLLAATWRVRFANPGVVDELRRRRQPFVHVLWHGQLLPLLWTHRARGVAVMISEHRDGELIARVAHSLGFHTVRGSTSRGAARALLGACREIESGRDLAITVDGPRGPAGTVAPGALVISQRTSAPLVPTAAAASSAWRLKSWDRFMIPKPFARVVVTYGEPLRVEAESARDAGTDTDRVRVALDAASRSAEERISARA